MVSDKKIQLLENVCIPALEEYDGEINDGMDIYNAVATYGYNFTSLRAMMFNHWQELNGWLTPIKAAQYMKLSVGYIRQLARKGIPCLESVREDRHWKIRLSSINDWLIKNGKVQIA